MNSQKHQFSQSELQTLVENIRIWGRELGFAQIGICDLDLGIHTERYQAWLAKNYHGDMDYLGNNQALREDPQLLHPGTLRVITARMDYLSADTQSMQVLQDPNKAYVSRYALGRDYHKLIRKRLTQLGKRIEQEIALLCPQPAGDTADEKQAQGYRAFVDSAPVLERALAEKSGQGWIGKNTMLINRKAGSWFFLGELFTDLPLPVDEPELKNHCGSCQACLDICPTKAFVDPYTLDARRCISYLTIESADSIPLELRKGIGNRVFGCDDCQLVCPWNRFSKATQETDFLPRHKLDSSDLADLFIWTEEEFLERTQGSAIRRTGYQGWSRNLAVGLGNAPTSDKVVNALQDRLAGAEAMLGEHIVWALAQHGLTPNT